MKTNEIKETKETKKNTGEKCILDKQGPRGKMSIDICKFVDPS